MDISSRRDSTSFIDPSKTTPTKTSVKRGAGTSLGNVENEGVGTSVRNVKNQGVATSLKNGENGGAGTSLQNVATGGAGTNLQNVARGGAGTSLGKGVETQPLLRRALLREDGMRTPDRDSYHTLKQRANTDLRRRNEIPTLR